MFPAPIPTSGCQVAVYTRRKALRARCKWMKRRLIPCLAIAGTDKRGFSISQLMAEPLELKKTLNLPKTDFPMKASLPQNEPKQLAAWEEAHLYEKILETRKGKPLFVLHDGPPYPTGTIHLGTGLNKILKDMIVKSESMAGHYAPYVPGWDCHGLPIETQVEKELGGKGKVPAAEFRKLCRAVRDALCGTTQERFQAARSVWTLERSLPDDEFRI